MIASAISSGFPRRRKGIARTRASLRFSSGCWWNSGVSVGPGHTTLTLMRYLASSRARDFVKAIMPPFAAAADASGVAGHIDDLARPVLHHPGDDLLGQPDAAHQIDGNDAVPDGRVVVNKVLDPVPACRIDEGAHRAAGARMDRIREGIDGRTINQVELDEINGRFGRFSFLDDLSPALLIDIADNDPGSRRSGHQRGRASHAGGASGYDNGLSVQAHGDTSLA